MSRKLTYRAWGSPSGLLFRAFARNSRAEALPHLGQGCTLTPPALPPAGPGRGNRTRQKDTDKDSRRQDLPRRSQVSAQICAISV